MKHLQIIVIAVLLLITSSNSFARFTNGNVITTIKSARTSSINPAKKYIEVQIKNTTSDTLYIQQLSVNTYERSTVIYNGDNLDSNAFDSYILITNFKGQLNEPNNPFTVHKDSYKEDKTFLAGNKNLPHRNVHNYNCYVIKPHATITVRTVVTIPTGEIARLPDMSKQERDGLLFQLGFKVTYYTADEISSSLWLQTEKSELLKKQLIKWMY